MNAEAVQERIVKNCINAAAFYCTPLQFFSSVYISFLYRYKFRTSACSNLVCVRRVRNATSKCPLMGSDGHSCCMQTRMPFRALPTRPTSRVIGTGGGWPADWWGGGGPSRLTTARVEPASKSFRAVLIDALFSDVAIVAWCILAIICYILSSWSLEAPQSLSLRKQPCGATMETPPCTLFLSRRDGLKRNIFFLRVCFLVLLVMAWLTANEEIAEELNSPSCTCICWPFCLFDFNSFGGCSMKCGFIFFSTSSKLYIEDPGQKKANFSIFLCTVSWVWEKNHKYYGYFCFYLCSCTQLLFV